MINSQPISKDTAKENKASEEPTDREKLLEMQVKMMKANMESMQTFMQTMMTSFQNAITGASATNTSKDEDSLKIPKLKDLAISTFLGSLTYLC